MPIALGQILANPVLAATSGIATVFLKMRGVHLEGPVVCFGRPPVLFRNGLIRVGRETKFRSRLLRMEFGADNGGTLVVGAGTSFGSGTSVVAHHSIVIGQNCRIGDLAAIFDTNHHPVDSATPVRAGPVVLGDNVFVGRAAMIMPGVSIGDNSVVGAYSVVVADVPRDTLMVGTAARAVRQLEVEPGWVRPGTPLTARRGSSFSALSALSALSAIGAISAIRAIRETHVN